MISCKLCGSFDLLPVNPPNDKRAYWFCNICYLISVDPRFYLSGEAEKERYLHHQNHFNDQGYVDFLNKLIDPAFEYLQKDMVCLDYGCGHTPVLSQLLNEKGVECYNFDPLFEMKHPMSQYDFIFSTETFEHFFHPKIELNTIGNLLNAGGYLGIMTDQWENLQQFNAWYYKRDFTHVSFYHSNTIQYIADHFGYSILFQDRNRVTILKKVITFRKDNVDKRN